MKNVTIEIDNAGGITLECAALKWASYHLKIEQAAEIAVALFGTPSLEGWEGNEWDEDVRAEPRPESVVVSAPTATELLFRLQETGRGGRAAQRFGEWLVSLGNRQC